MTSLIYEVNLHVEASIDQQYRDWLREHVDEMLRFEGFKEATIFERMDGDHSDRKEIVVHYLVDDERHLQEYFENHAPRMRSEAGTIFGDKFSASRRVLARSEAGQ